MHLLKRLTDGDGMTLQVFGLACQFVQKVPFSNR